MGNKTLVVGELLKTVDTSLDTIALVLDGNLNIRELGKYKQKMERLGRSIERLTGIIEGNFDYCSLIPQMIEIRVKYKILASIIQ